MPAEDGQYTDLVATRSGPNANPRAVEVFSSLIRHLHHFAREVQLTNEEWLLACQAMIEAGQISGKERNEMILISDVLGLEALLDTMTHERFVAAHSASKSKSKVNGNGNGNSNGTTQETPSSTTSGEEAQITLSAILGPFYREGAPEYKNGESILKTHEEGDVTCHVFGKVLGVDGKVVEGAEVHIWHDGSKGLYDSQLYDPQNPDKYPYFNWRGIFKTDSEGKYDVIALKPTPYPIPYDNTAGAILKAMDNSPMRPSHIHFWIKAPGYRPLITQVYNKDCKYIDMDSVFGVKDALTVTFKDSKNKSIADTELEYDFVLVPDTD